MRPKRISALVLVLSISLGLAACGGSGSGPSEDRVSDEPAAPVLLVAGRWKSTASNDGETLEIDATGLVVEAYGADVPVGITFSEDAPGVYVSREGARPISIILEPTKSYALVTWEHGQGAVLVRSAIPDADTPFDPTAVASATWVGLAAATVDAEITATTSMTTRIFEDHTYELRYGDGRFYGADQNLAKVIASEDEESVYRSRHVADGAEHHVLWFLSGDENGLWGVVFSAGGVVVEYWILARAPAEEESEGP